MAVAYALLRFFVVAIAMFLIASFYASRQATVKLIKVGNLNKTVHALTYTALIEEEARKLSAGA
jgi:hypothetical protein